MVKLLLEFVYTRYKGSYQHMISTILDGQWMVLLLKSIWKTLIEASKTCMVLVKCGCKQKHLKCCKCKKHRLPFKELCLCSSGWVAWTQTSCWIYGINLAVQCVGYISFCVVSCYSTIKDLKNDCWNVPSPVYIVFGHCP